MQKAKEHAAYVGPGIDLLDNAVIVNHAVAYDDKEAFSELHRTRAAFERSMDATMELIPTSQRNGQKA